MNGNHQDGTGAGRRSWKTNWTKYSRKDNPGLSDKSTCTQEGVCQLLPILKNYNKIEQPIKGSGYIFHTMSTDLH